MNGNPRPTNPRKRVLSVKVIPGLKLQKRRLTMTKLKICTVCGKEKPIDFFFKNKTKRHGIDPSCKFCTKQRNVKYQKNNKEKILKNKLLYYNNNKKTISEKRAIWRKNNKPLIKKRSRIYYAQNKEKIAIKDTLYHKNNKEMIQRKSLEYSKAAASFSVYATQIAWIESVRKDPKNEKKLQVRCSLCEKWFTPTNIQIKHRISAINGKQTAGAEHHLYCSDGCKQKCPVFKKISYRKNQAPHYHRPGQKEWKDHVMSCAEYRCEKCDKIIESGEAHHVKSVSQYPLQSMDVNNGLYLCKKCHKEIHSIQGCRPVDLRQNATNLRC